MLMCHYYTYCIYIYVFTYMDSNTVHIYIDMSYFIYLLVVSVYFVKGLVPQR